MNFKSSIMDLIIPIIKSSSFQNSISEKKVTAEETSTAIVESNSAVLDDSDFLAGMSSATARIVIEKNLPKITKIYTI
jgi:hypothetical protein